MAGLDIKPNETRQEFVFMSAVAALDGEVSSRMIADRMRDVALHEFDSAAAASGPRRLVRLIDDAESQRVLEAVSMDRWVATPRAIEFRDSLKRLLRSPEFI